MTIHICPNCQYKFRDSADLEQRVAELVAEWEQRCAQRGHMMPSGRVSESVAAELLGQRKLWIANLRNADKGPRIIYAPAGRGHFSYNMRDLAEWWLRRNSDECES